MESQNSIIPESKGAKMNWKRVDWMKISIAAVIIIAVIIGAYLVLRPASAALKSGDSAGLEFTITSDGKALASNESVFSVGSVGEQFGLATSKVDDALIGHKKGDTVTIALSPSEAYGDYDPSKIEVINRTQTIGKRVDIINRTITISLSSFKQTFNEDPVKDKVYSPQGAPWSYKVLKFDNSTVTFSQETAVGKIIPVSELMFAEVTQVASDKITTKLTLNTENQTVKATPDINVTYFSDKDYLYMRLTPSVGAIFPLSQTLTGKVMSFNETSITLDENSPLAGKTLEFQFKITDVKNAKTISNLGSDASDIKGAPTLQTFVMSYCPYGLQMEKGVIPAYELLKGKANFKIRFVSYTLHGDKEVQENSRQVCIREETKQFWPYLQCFVDKGTASACMQSAGIDETKINDCMANRAKSYLDVDNQLNTQFSVQGSPTNVLNDKEAQIYPRSPQDVLNSVCAAFTSKPAECSQTLDSLNPSAGFGFGTSSATTSASCGA